MVVCLGFGDGVVEEPVKAGFEGLADVAVDDGAFDAEVAGEGGDVAMVEVGLSLKGGDDVEVAVSVGEELGEFWMVFEAWVFGVENLVELGFVRYRNVVNLWLPKLNRWLVIRLDCMYVVCGVMMGVGLVH